MKFYEIVRLSKLITIKWNYFLVNGPNHNYLS